MSTSALKAAATGQVPAKEARNPYEQLKHQLEVSRGEFVKLVGSTANADRFIRVVLNSVLANPKLMDVSRASLVAACMKAAQDGLMPDGREAVLNIYSTKVKGGRGEEDRWENRAQYLPMVGGLIKKLYSGGDVTYVDATVVHKGDNFKYKRGDEPGIEHEPKGGTDAEVIAAYAIVKLKNGEIKREVMWRADIERVRAASKSADSGPWKTWWSEMAIKSVLKRIYKQLPHADAFDEIERYDNEAMGYNGLGESVAAVANRALDEAAGEQQQALGNDPSDVLEQDVGHPLGEKALAEDVASHGHADRVRAAADEVADAAEALGVVSQSDQDAARAVEVKMRAAKTVEALDLAADGGRAVKDKALRLRLDELYEARAAELK